MPQSKPKTASDNAGCLVVLAVMGGTAWFLSRSGASFWGWVLGLSAALFASVPLVGLVTSLFESGSPAATPPPVQATARRGRVCPRCGREGLPKVANYCPVCGQSLRKRRKKPPD